MEEEGSVETSNSISKRVNGRVMVGWASMFLLVGRPENLCVTDRMGDEIGFSEIKQALSLSTVSLPPPPMKTICRMVA